MTAPIRQPAIVLSRVKTRGEDVGVVVRVVRRLLRPLQTEAKQTECTFAGTYEHARRNVHTQHNLHP